MLQTGPILQPGRRQSAQPPGSMAAFRNSNTVPVP